MSGALLAVPSSAPFEDVADGNPVGKNEYSRLDARAQATLEFRAIRLLIHPWPGT